jgi:hypothetical protein
MISFLVIWIIKQVYRAFFCLFSHTTRKKPSSNRKRLTKRYATVELINYKRIVTQTTVSYT